MALSAVGVAAILALALAGEAQYNWFQRLSKLSVGGAAVELSPLAGAIAAGETKPDQRPGSAAERGVAAGPGTVSLALRTALNIDFYVGKDRKRVIGLGSLSDFDGNVPGSVENFFRIVVKPTAFALSAIHARKQSKDIYATAIDHDFIEIVRKLSTYGYHDEPTPAGGQAVSNEYIEDLGAFKMGVQKIWTQICKDESIYLTPERYKNAENLYHQIFHVAMPSCQTRANDVAGAIDKVIAETQPENSYVLARSRPYGLILSAAILTAAGENDAAIADLSARAQELSTWLKQNIDGRDNTTKQIFLYRILGALDNFLLAKGTDKSADFHTLVYLSKTIDLGDDLIREIDADSLKRYVKATVGKNSCPARSIQPAFDEMLLQDLIMTNNFIFKLSKYPDLVNSQYSAARLAEKADFLTSLDLGCLVPDAHDARDLERAFYDTQTLAFSALAEITKADNQGASRNYMCQALSAEKHARNLVTIEANMLSDAGFKFSLDTKDGGNEQRDHLVELEDTLNLEALAEQIRSELAETGGSASCL